MAKELRAIAAKRNATQVSSKISRLTDQYP
jgi:hypothetical protein